MQTLERDDAVVLEPEAPATAAVIWLHGLGADGHDFPPVVHALDLGDRPWRFIFPHAPLRPVTINGGQRMRAWYDILSLTDAGLQDAEGIEASRAIVEARLDAESAAGVVPDRIILAGFSQGGAIALHTGLRHPQRLAGILALSTYLPLHGRLPSEAADANRDTPILMCHGSEDAVLPLALGTASRDGLRALGYAVQWRDYRMGHEVCMDEIADIGGWLRQRLD